MSKHPLTTQHGRSRTLASFKTSTHIKLGFWVQQRWLHFHFV